MTDQNSNPKGYDDKVDVEKLNTDFSTPAGEGNMDAVRTPSPAELQADYYDKYPKLAGMPIVAVREIDGQITDFKLQNGDVLSYSQMLSRSLDFEGLIIGSDQEGKETIRTSPDGWKGNNLNELPRF